MEFLLKKIFMKNLLTNNFFYIGNIYMEINCNNIIEKYLLNKNPLYAFSFPIALIVGIIFFGVSKAYKWSDNDYINQILVPIVALLLTMVLIDFISRAMICQIEKKTLVSKCNSWKKNQDSQHKLSKNYQKPIENFSSGRPSIQDNEIHNNLPTIKDYILDYDKIDNFKKEYSIENIVSEIPNISPGSLESTEQNGKCSDGKTCFSLCSGIDKKPEYMVAPIPGPNWLPKSAETVQNELKSNIYTAASCKGILSK